MEVTIQLSESLKEFVEAEVMAGGHGTTANYFQALLLEARKRKARERIETALEEGLNSGEPIPWNSQELESIRQELADRREQRKRVES